LDEDAGTCSYRVVAISRREGWGWETSDLDVCTHSSWTLGDARKLSSAESFKFDRRVKVKNETPGTVTAVYAVPSALRMPRPVTGKSWIADRAIGPRESRIVDFNDDSGTCNYDLRATLDPGPDWSAQDFNVCERSQWVLMN
jgi:hypothetical protein